MMTIEQTAETITIWINSCNTSEQLNMCRDIIDKQIYDRFKNHVTPLVMVLVKNELDEAIEKRTAQLCTYLKPSGVEVTSTDMRYFKDELKRFDPKDKNEEADETATATEEADGDDDGGDDSEG